MIIKPRYESIELKRLRSLNNRMTLSVKDEKYYTNLEKGYTGEQKFDELLVNVSDDYLILNDLLLDSSNTVFQIDTLLISPEMTYLFEVKNYEGDFFIEGDRWYTTSRTEIKNPILQLERSESLIRRLLQELGYTPSIEAYLIFIHHDFYLYQAPLHLPIIFPPQLNRLIKKINKSTSKINDRHLKSAEQLLSLHLHESPYIRTPDYTYDQLKKGITCLSCHSFINDFSKKALVCKKCGHQEDPTAAILRSTEEIKLLFPNKKITTNTIHEWCKIINSKKTIRRILSTNFKSMGSGKHTYYVNTQATNGFETRT